MSIEAPAAEAPARSHRMPRQERRAQLLEAAQEVFVDLGYHTAGMDDIAERAGVSKPVLYQHFPGKRDLYLALLKQTHAQLGAILTHALENSNDCRERVQNAISAYFDFMTAEGASYRLIFESDMISDPQVGEQLNAFNDTIVASIAEQLRNDGIQDVETSHLLATAVIGTAQNAARDWVRRGETMPLNDAKKLVYTLAWGGFDGVLEHYATDDAAAMPGIEPN